jgi:hypothetical protein
MSGVRVSHEVHENEALPELQQGALLMASVVTITVQLDQGGAITNVEALKKALQDLGFKMPPIGKQGQEAFNGIESAERRAHLAGMLFARTTGVEIPRALENVIAHSRVLGPLLAGMFNVAVAGAAISALGVIYEKLVNITEAAGGYTEEVKKIEQATIQASQSAFFNPATLDAASRNMAQIAAQQAALNDRSLQGISNRFNKLVDESGLLSRIFGIAQMRAGLEVFFNKDVAEGVRLDDQRRQLLEKQTQEIQKQNEQAAQLLAKNNEMGLQGYALAKQKYQDFLANPNFIAKQVRDPQGAAAEQEGAYLEMQKSIMDLRRQNAQESMNLQHQVATDAVQGEQRIYQEEKNRLADLDQKRKQSLIDDKDYYAQRDLIAKRTAQQIKQYEQQLADQTKAFQDEAVDAFLKGDDLIYRQQQEAVDKARAEYERAPSTAAWERYESAIVAADAKAQAQIIANREATAQKEVQIQKQLESMTKQSTDKTAAAQEEAALLAVPEWKHATAQLQVELTKRLAAVQEEYDKETAALEKMVTAGDVTRQQADTVELQYAQQTAAQRFAIEQALMLKIRDANQKMAEQLGGQMEQVFNDIGSGKLGQDILNAVKKLFFQILAQWILTTTQMGSIVQQLFGSLTGNNSAILGPGGLLGGLFGNSTRGGGLFGSGTGSGSNSGGGLLGSLFGSGSGSSNASVAGLSASSLPSGLGMFTGPGGIIASQVPGSVAGAASMAGASGSLTTQSIAAASGGAIGSGVSGAAVTLAAPSLGARMGSLFSSSTLLNMAPLAAMMLGGKFGGTTGQIGGMMTALTMMAIINPTGPVAGLLGAMLGPGSLAAAAFTGVGAGLLGFGVGMQHGPLAGSLVGAGTGLGMAGLFALAGASLGPVGLAIAGIIGLLGGLFGGLFGGSKRKKEANNYFSQQLDPAIKKIVGDYESFQLDYASASGQLTQLEQQAKDQLHKLKGEGDGVFKDKVMPAITAAEARIGKDEAERTRRAGLVFGPPQFHDGGLVSSTMSAYTTKPNELLALLKHGEFVVNPQATSKNLNALQALNSGGKLPSGSDVHVHLHAWDAAGVDKWLRNGGAKLIADGLDRHWNKEGG